jgi:hypothetical protein
MTMRVLVIHDRVADLQSGWVSCPGGLVCLEEGPRRLLAWMTVRRATGHTDLVRGMPSPWMRRLRHVLEGETAAPRVVLGDAQRGWTLAAAATLPATPGSRVVRAAAVVQAAPNLAAAGEGGVALRLIAALLPPTVTPHRMLRAKLRVARVKIALSLGGVSPRRLAEDLSLAETEGGDSLEISLGLWALRGELALVQDDLAGAHRWLVRAHSAAEHLERPAEVARLLSRLAAVSRQLGEPRRALRLLRRAVRSLDADRNPLVLARLLTELAWQEHGMGANADARTHLNLAWAVVPTGQDLLRARIRGGLEALPRRVGRASLAVAQGGAEGGAERMTWDPERSTG